MSVDEMTKVQLINRITAYDEHYKTIIGRLYARDVNYLRLLLYKLMKKVKALDSITCTVCEYNDIYQEDEIDQDIFGLYVTCHKCGARVRLKGI